MKDDPLIFNICSSRVSPRTSVGVVVVQKIEGSFAPKVRACTRY